MLARQISRTKQKTMFKPKPLTVPNVFAKLTEIAKISGNSVRRCLPRNPLENAGCR